MNTTMSKTDIRQAPSDHLAHRLTELAKQAREKAEEAQPFIKEDLQDMAELFDESARRLRIKPRETFNHEAFE